jgi:nucleoporin NDC1
MKRDPTTPVASPRTRLYKEFLTPALHRRFVNAAAVTLVLCWADATFLSPFFFSRAGLLWSWFPLGATGIRALLLFVPCLAVFIVRVANMHVGNYTASSDAAALIGRFTGVSGIGSVAHTAAWYIWSGWFFGEVFIWSQKSTRTELAWVDEGSQLERSRLNENPIFLRCWFVVLGLSQAGLHLLRDYDFVDLQTDEKRAERFNPFVAYFGVPAAAMEKLPLAVRGLAQQSGTILNRALTLTFGGLFLLHFPLYYLLVRGTAWTWTYSIVKPLFGLDEAAPPTGLVQFPTLFIQAIYAGLMLALLWEVSNASFSAIVAQPPLKKGEPLTSEIKDSRGAVIHRSRDPNGSLLTGLKSKKPVPKAFAFWELYIICTSFETRRRTIYTEVDRAGGNTWSQICALCLAEISAVKTRVEAANDPIAFKAKLQADAERRRLHEEMIANPEERPLGLKRIADQGVLTNADVFAKRTPDLGASLGNFTKSIGQSPGAVNPVSPHARKALQWTADAVLSKEEQQRLAAASASTGTGLLEKFLPRQYLVQFLRTPIGAPFRQTLGRRLSSTVFGQGESGKGNLIHAVKILERLIMSSLQEDQFGSVQKDVAEVVRHLTATVVLMEKFVMEARPHWSDVERPRGSSEKGEVVEVLDILKGSLEQIILGFGEYSEGLGLSLKEVREAREAAVVLPTRKPIEAAPERRPEQIAGRERRPEQVAGRERRTEQVAGRERRTDGRVEHSERDLRRPEMEQVEKPRRRRE